MPVELTNWTDFEKAAKDATRIIFMKRGETIVVSTTQFFIVAEPSKQVLNFLAQTNALAVGRAKRWEDLFS